MPVKENPIHVVHAREDDAYCALDGELELLHADADPAAVADSLAITLDASVETTLEALYRLDLAAPAIRTLEALGVSDRVVRPPAVLAASQGVALRLGFIWRVDGARRGARIEPAAFDAFSAPGHVKVRWEFQVRPSAGGGALLSIATLIAGTDAFSRARLLDAWGLVAAFASTFARRAAAAVRAYAEEDLEDDRAA